MASPLLTVIVPTYKEKGNMEPLVQGLTAALDAEHIPHEILVMDDNSPDGTAAECARLQPAFPRLRCVVRTTNRGLSPAVIDGFSEARGDVLLVMDADLSHPIEVVPKLYRRVASADAVVAVGSRHCKGGEITQWPAHRRVISWGAATLARPLASCTDPMSGFFCMRPAVIKGVKLNAAGFKILLEILVKGNYATVVEEPITFKDRTVGESKLTRGVMINYILHLISLYLYPGSAPLFKFLAVGGIGMVLDITLFTLIHFTAHFSTCYSQCLSFFAALCSNFFLNRLWTFRAPVSVSGRSRSPVPQFVKFSVVSLIALGLRTALFLSISNVLHIQKSPQIQILLVSVIVLVTAVNFLGSKHWAFK
jgi:dolichol-phosphate mannosyltransferase